MPAIAISHLTKFYGRSKQAAVRDVSLSIKSGEVYGFLGANGAGKSTTIRAALGFLQPSSGNIKLLGKLVADKNVDIRSSVGYLPGDVILPRGTTGRKLLAYLAELSGGVDKTYKDQLVERFEAQLDVSVDSLSKGNRQKIGIIQAFMHQPKVLILDEPTSGLDPLMQEQFYKTVEEACARGAAILMSSHNFDEVQRICDRVGIIKKGELVFEGTIGQMSVAQMPRLRLKLENNADVKKLAADKALKIISKNGAVVVVEPAKSIQAALGAISKFKITSMTMEQHELEEEFMNFYEDQGDKGEQSL